MALAYLLNGRVAELEESNAQLPALLDLDPPKPTIGPDWVSLKMASGLTGLTVSGLRAQIRAGRIRAHKLGGRILIISVSTLPPPRPVFAVSLKLLELQLLEALQQAEAVQRSLDRARAKIALPPISHRRSADADRAWAAMLADRHASQCSRWWTYDSLVDLRF